MPVPDGSASPQIFISYRREDTAGYAGRLYDALGERFGKKRVFMDIDSIRGGARVREVVKESVGSCDIVIALIGKRWSSVVDRDGRRRLDEPDDWVRLELETALGRKTAQVIPTLVQGAPMPPSDELPRELEELSDRNAVELSDARWHEDVDRLIGSFDLEGRLPAPPKPTQRRPAWFAPALVAAALALAGIVAAIFLLSMGDDGPNQDLARYVNGIDAQLEHSAQTKGDLVGLIGKVEDRSISREKALGLISEIIGQRTTLRASLPPDPPEAFRDAQQLLRRSITVSLKDDVAVKKWIEASYSGSDDVAARKREYEALSLEASRLKEAFLSTYNHLRERLLERPPLALTTY
jgi:hypothetical protein